MYDTVILGGGPAGLQAALTLGRVHVRAMLFDAGAYRNDPTRHAHNVLALDGVPPAEIRRRARAELAAYASVELRDEAVDAVARDGDGFTVTTRAGENVRARTVILATGLRDELPPVPGLAEHWGTRVAHCPFCHGHEFAGSPVAVLGEGPHAAIQSAKLRALASSVEIVAPHTVRAVEDVPGGLRILRDDGAPLEVAGVFVAPRTAQSAPFAQQLGLTLTPAGTVPVDALARTDVPGLYAAGDMAQNDAWPAPLSSIVLAEAGGQLAAFDIVQSFARAALPA